MDLPTPEAPSRATVAPSASQVAQRLEAGSWGAETGSRSQPAALAATVTTAAARVGVQVGLGEHDHRPRARGPGQREQPLDPAEVEVRHHRLDHGDDVGVRGKHLGVRRARDPQPLDGGAPRQQRRITDHGAAADSPW